MKKQIIDFFKEAWWVWKDGYNYEIKTKYAVRELTHLLQKSGVSMPGDLELHKFFDYNSPLYKHWINKGFETYMRSNKRKRS